MTDIALIPHNRRSIGGRNNRHFIYQAERPDVAAQDIEEVGRTVAALGRAQALPAAEIEILSLSQFFCYSTPASAQASTRRILKTLGVKEEEGEFGDVSFVFCDWAAPHEDLPFAGSAFASLVLHTGPYPYWMSMFHSRVSESSGEWALESNTRILRTGDLLVFDPTIPHMCTPVRPHQDQYLVLLQLELPIGEKAEVKALLKRFPVAATDKCAETRSKDEERARSMSAR